jgi:hypothetical protein
VVKCKGCAWICEVSRKVFDGKERSEGREKLKYLQA